MFYRPGCFTDLDVLPTWMFYRPGCFTDLDVLPTWIVYWLFFIGKVVANLCVEHPWDSQKMISRWKNRRCSRGCGQEDFECRESHGKPVRVCKLVTGTTPVPQYPSTPVPQYPSTPVPQYPSTPVPQYPSTPVPQYPSTPVPQYPSTPVPQYPSTPVPQYPVVLFLLFLYNAHNHLMIAGHMISSCGNYSTIVVSHPTTILRGRCLTSVTEA